MVNKHWNRAPASQQLKSTDNKLTDMHILTAKCNLLMITCTGNKFLSSLYTIYLSLTCSFFILPKKKKKEKKQEKKIKKQIIMHEKNLLSYLRIANDSDKPSKDK